jgi:outer membrane receptor protein involved in Fe transport
MLELPIVRDRLRLVGGVRMEDSHIQLDTKVFNDGTLCDPNQTICAASITRDEQDLLPAVSLIFSPRSDMNLRVGWGETVSRPEFRELAPTRFPAARGERAQVGNISLVQSAWTSYDVRWEWLPSAADVLSLSAFWKEGTDPIEKVEVSEASDQIETWVNAKKTTLLGLEFEGRKDLGFLGRPARGFSLQTNVTYFPRKETTVPVAIVAGLPTQQTNSTRDPADVPDFIVNAALEYTRPEAVTASLLYSTIGPTLTRAGSLGIPDAFDQRSDTLDALLQFPLRRWLKAPVTLQLSAENILNDQVVEMQGDFVTKRYTRGVSFGLSISYSP